MTKRANKIIFTQKSQLANKAKKRIAVAMSGGVDSSVAAALLKQQGYDVIGIFMQFWAPSGAKYGENRCCSLESWNEAREVARLLDIPIYKVNFGRQFKKQIVDEFLAEYKAGRTPNPCVSCNKFIKFDSLLKYAQTVFNADYLATGHYARLWREFPISQFLPAGRQVQFPNKISKKYPISNIQYSLHRPKDKNKDQTYFIYNLKQEQLKYLLFPLADYKKEQVRGLARKFKLPIHNKPDSQEICFVGKSHYDFLAQYLKPKVGQIIDETGKTLGEHRGLVFYTLGQRSGIGLSGGPWYVVGFKRKKNELIVSKNFDSDLSANRRIYFKNASWLDGKIKLPLKAQAEIRYHAKPAKCVIKKCGQRLMAEFERPPRAAAPGQSIVFYDDDRLIGGGIIS